MLGNKESSNLYWCIFTWSYQILRLKLLFLVLEAPTVVDEAILSAAFESQELKTQGCAVSFRV